MFPGHKALQKELAAVVRPKKMRLNLKQSKDNFTKPQPCESINRGDIEDSAEAMWKHAEREQANQVAKDLKRKQKHEKEREAKRRRKEVEKEAKCLRTEGQN